MAAPTTMTTGEYQGLAALLIRTPFSTAAVSLHGGQVLSFVPHGFDDVLWLSPASKRPPAAIRGGIPVCWPYFARQGQADDVPQHGPVRTLPWQVLASSIEDDGTLNLQLAPPAMPGESLSLTQTLRIGHALQQSLHTCNHGNQEQRFTQALHSYFNVADALQVRVTGLQGCDYLDKHDGMRRHTQSGDWDLRDPRDPGRSDRIYLGTGSDFKLVDPVAGRCLSIKTRGSQTLVVWNPGEAGQRTFVDLSDRDWQHFVCLEAANAGEEVIELAPGQTHTLQQILSVSSL